MNPYYINFLCNALLGRNPDQYFNQHKRDIIQAAKLIRYKIPTASGKAFRGIILGQDHCIDLKCKPLSHIRFVSFSENREIAKTFADTLHPMSMMMHLIRPKDQGYLIEYEYEACELLFHYTWIDFLKLERYLPISALIEQKEVMIKAGPTFQLTTFEPGTSDQNLNRDHENFEPIEFKQYRNGELKMTPHEFLNHINRKYRL